MNFYSYGYLKSHILTANIFQSVLFILFFGIVVFATFMYYRTKGDSKYRELIIIFMIAITLMICLKINDYRNYNAVNSSYLDSVNILETAANKFGVDKEELYITRGNDTMGNIVKTKDWYYRVIKNGNNLMFERIYMLNPDIKLVEERK